MSYPQDKYETPFDFLVALIKGEAGYAYDYGKAGILPEARLALMTLLGKGDYSKEIIADVKVAIGDGYEEGLKRFAQGVVSAEVRRINNGNYSTDPTEDGFLIFGLCELAGLEIENYGTKFSTLYYRIKYRQAEACTDPWTKAMLMAEYGAIQECPGIATEFFKAVYGQFRYADYAEALK